MLYFLTYVHQNHVSIIVNLGRGWKTTYNNSNSNKTSQFILNGEFGEFPPGIF